MRRGHRACVSVSALLAGSAAAVGVLLAGCGGSTVSSVVDPIAQAAQVSELAPGFKASLSEELLSPGASEPVMASGSGVFAQHDQRGAISMQVHIEGHSSGVEAQYADLSMYMHLPSAQGSPVTHGRPWIEFDLRGVGAAMGIDHSALSGSEASNPSQLLSLLKATGSQAMRIGTEQVRGVSTTHYRARIDYQQYADTVAPAQRSAARASVAALERLTGTHSQVVDVWVDGRDRVRREQLTYQECLPSAPGKTQIHLTAEYYDYGVQAMPALPPSREVADVTGAVVRKLRHVRLGCQ